ncbi:BatD [Hydrogenimonas sp.]|nr:BatD [Hydrogenimonas sp.]
MSIGGRVICSILLLVSTLFADVAARVDENPVIASEEVDYVIEATGDRVEFPKIGSIDGVKVTTEGSRRLEWFDGNRSVVKWVQVYSFTPKRSLTIPSFRVYVDGKSEWTKPIFLQVKPDHKAGNDDFLIELDVDRKEAYVGEAVNVVIRFKEKRNVPVMSVDFVPIKYDNFWVKRVAKRRRYSSGEYLVHEQRYIFFPQKAGELTIGPAEVKVAMAKKIRDAFGFIVRQPQWRSVVSESHKLRVKPLPDDLKLVGSFSIDVDVSPKKVEAGSPVTLVVHVEGTGNIDDFEPPPLHIRGVTVYPGEPILKSSYRGGVYGGSWERKYVLIADRSFTIPPFRVRFFDPVKLKEVTLSSDPVRIEVEGATAGPEEEVPPSEKGSRAGGGYGSTELYLSAAASFAAGMIFMYLLFRLEKRLSKKRPAALKPGSEEEMLQKLLPYISESKEAAQMAENIYANLFEGRAVRIDKKAFQSLMERLVDRS